MFIACFITFSYFLKETDNSWRDQIAAHVAAEYYLDQQNNRQIEKGAK